MTIESQQTAIPPTPAPKEDPKIDEVKRYEKIYDISKEMFTYSEGVVKSIEEKSRNNLTAAIAIMGFAFIIRKPPEIRTLMWYDLLIMLLAALCVGYVYYYYLETIKSKSFKLPSMEQLINLRTETSYPNGVIRNNFESFQNMYGQNLKLIDDKGKFLKKQQKLLGAVLLFALAYIVLSKVPPTDPETSILSPSWPTTTNAPSLSPPNQTQTPVPNPTTSTSTKVPTSKRVTTAPVTVPTTEKDVDKIKP